MPAPSAERAHAAAAVASALPPLVLAAERLAASVVVPGPHGQRRAGSGDAFWQYRPYIAGDPAARVDWRQSARSDRLFIREREQVAARTAWLWRDPSARMDWRSAGAGPTKAERADLLLAAIAALLLRGGERVGWLDRPTPPVTGRAALGRLLAAAAVPERESQPVRPGAIVLAGDFLGEPEPLATLRGKYARASGVLLQVLDPAEADLPYAGRVRFLAADRTATTTVIGRAEDVRTPYAERLSAQADAIADAARGWPVIRHVVGHSPATALLALHRALSA